MDGEAMTYGDKRHQEFRRSLIVDAIRAEFIATALLDPNPDYVAEWNKRFQDGMAWSKADFARRTALRDIAERYGYNPETMSPV